jgi:hypothetical protein
MRILCTCACIYISLHQSLSLVLKHPHLCMRIHQLASTTLASAQTAVCLYAYTLTCINCTRQCSNSRACACIYISPHQPLQTAELVHAYAFVLLHAYTSACINHSHWHSSIHTCACIYICTCVCIYINLHE